MHPRRLVESQNRQWTCGSSCTRNFGTLLLDSCSYWSETSSRGIACHFSSVGNRRGCRLSAVLGSISPGRSASPGGRCLSHPELSWVRHYHRVDSPRYVALQSLGTVGSLDLVAGSFTGTHRILPDLGKPGRPAAGIGPIAQWRALGAMAMFRQSSTPRGGFPKKGAGRGPITMLPPA